MVPRSCNPCKVIIASGEDEDADEDVYDSAAFIIADVIYHQQALRTTSVLLCSATEVLLDNQAGRSNSNNRSLLSNVSTVEPFYISGIDGEFRGVRISEEGDFEGLGRVAYGTTAAEDILSKARHCLLQLVKG